MTYQKMKLEVGDRVGRFVIIGPTVTKNGKDSYSWCQCDCGTLWLASRSGIRKGKILSCGCLRKEKFAESNKTHGMRPRGAPSPEYAAWASIIQRCTNAKSKAFAYYGARGITVCERWKKFENFFGDMGVRPKGTSIDRIDNSGNYEPGNCRWATRTEQMRNTRGNRNVLHNGELLCVRVACQKAGISEGRVYWWAHKHRVSHQEAFDKYLNALLTGSTLPGGGV